MNNKYIIATLLLTVVLIGCSKNSESTNNYNSNFKHNDSFKAIEKTIMTSSANYVYETPEQPRNTADEELSEYESKDNETIFKENLEANIDMSNSNIDMEAAANEFNERQSKAEENNFSNLDNFEWSFIDKEYKVPGEVKDTGDEYASISSYVVKQSMKYFDTEQYYAVASDIQQMSFTYYTDGVNANYNVYYSYDEPGIYVYAYVE